MQPAEPGTSLPARFKQLAQEQPDAPALRFGDAAMSRIDVERSAEALAQELADGGVDFGDYVAVVLPNGFEHPIAFMAAWKLGAVPLPISPKLAPREIAGIIDLANPAAVVGITEPELVVDRLSFPRDHVPTLDESRELPDAVSPVWKAPTSGGSSGRPKVIRAGQPALFEAVAGFAPIGRMGPGTRALVPVPMAHNTGTTALLALLVGGEAVIMPKFDAEEFLRLIERHRVTWTFVVPTMMTRIAKLPADVREKYDVSSIETVLHGAAPCPPDTKTAWLDWLGPEKVLELYASAEFQAATLIDGNDWLAHPGSVGRTILGEIEVRDQDGRPLPPGEVGRIWVRSPAALPPTYEYVGAEPVSDDKGWETVGDMGRLDEDGYLYLTDREGDMLLVGGANVYPAEVEAALVEHPSVLDACVIGLPDDDLGTVPHAIVEATKSLDVKELGAFVEARLARYKRPRSYEVVAEPIRDEAGKVRRAALVDART